MNSINYINDIIKILRSKGVPMEGCNEDEINRIQAIANNNLPKAYLEFLFTMGRGAGSYMADCDCFYPAMLETNEYAIHLLSDNDFPLSLPNNAFVFWERQGYQFAFFLLDGNDNPLVYYYSEGVNEVEFTQDENFVEFLYIELKQARII